MISLRFPETKQENGFSVVELFLIFLIVAVIGLAGWYVVSHRKVPVPRQSVSTTLANISQEISSKYIYISPDTSNSWNASAGSGASLAVPDYTYRVSSQNFPTIIISYNDHASPSSVKLSQAVDPIAKQQIQAAGYKLTNTKYDIPGYYVDYAKTTSVPTSNVYVAGNSTCLVIDDDLAQLSTVSCYDKADIAQAAMTGQPYVASYLAGHKDVSEKDITYGPVTVKSKNPNAVISASHATGYDIAEVAITVKTDKELVLFYNKDGGPWKYITQAHDEYGFSCTDYMATPEIRKVMYNQVCLRADRQGQVRLDTNNRATQ